MTAAVDALIAWQRAAPPPGLPAWDAHPHDCHRTRHAVRLVVARRDTAPPAPRGSPRRDVAQGPDGNTPPVAEGATLRRPPRLGIAGNLLRLADGRIGIIDFQGRGDGSHPAYDLASPACRTPAATSHPDAAARPAPWRNISPPRPRARRRGVHRVISGLRGGNGIFASPPASWVRLAFARRPAANTLAHGPRTWRLLRDALAQPAAARPWLLRSTVGYRPPTAATRPGLAP